MMKYDIAPNQYENELLKEHENYEYAQKRYLNEFIQDKEKTRPKKRGVGEYVGATILVIGISFIALFVIALIVMAISDPNELKDMGENIIVMPIGLGLAGLIFGAIIGLIISPICIAINRKRIRKWENNFDLDRSLMGNVVRDNIAKHKQETWQKIIEYNDNFEKNSEGFVQKYANSAFFKDIAKKVTELFVGCIKLYSRPSNKEEIKENYECIISNGCVRYKNVGYGYTYYDFDKHRIANLEDITSIYAFAYALAESVKKNVTEQYPKDTSGTSYKINIKYEEDGSCVKCIFTYSAKNGNYKTVQSW